MSRDYLRDYSTEAFRFYAREGSLEKYKQKLLKEIASSKDKGSGISKPTEAQMIKKEKILEDKKASIKDMQAVEDTISSFKLSNPFTYRTIEEVYFIRPNEDLYKGYIQDRVIAASINLNSDIRTIYSHLRKARLLFCINRGLRVEEYGKRGVKNE